MVPAQEPRYLLRSDHPQVAVTWSTSILSDRPKPDALKLRKRVTAWPLEFTFKVCARRCMHSHGSRSAAAGGTGGCCAGARTATSTFCCRQEGPTRAGSWLLLGLPSSVVFHHHHLMVQADYHTATREFTYGMMCRVGISKRLPRCRCCCAARQPLLPCRCCCRASSSAVQHHTAAPQPRVHVTRGCGCVRPLAVCAHVPAPQPGCSWEDPQVAD